MIFEIAVVELDFGKGLEAEHEAHADNSWKLAEDPASAVQVRHR